MKKRVRQRLPLDDETPPLVPAPVEDWSEIAKRDPKAFADKVKQAIFDSRIAIADHISTQYKRLNRLEKLRDVLEGYFSNPEFLKKMQDDATLALSVWESLGTEVSRVSLTLTNINKVMSGIQRMAEVSEDYRRRMDRVERAAIPESTGSKSPVVEILESTDDKRALRDMAVGRLKELLDGE